MRIELKLTVFTVISFISVIYVFQYVCKRCVTFVKISFLFFHWPCKNILNFLSIFTWLCSSVASQFSVKYIKQPKQQQEKKKNRGKQLSNNGSVASNFVCLFTLSAWIECECVRDSIAYAENVQEIKTAFILTKFHF